MPNRNVPASAIGLPVSRRNLLGRGAAAAISGVTIGAVAAAATDAAVNPAEGADHLDDAEIFEIASRYNAAEDHFCRLLRNTGDVLESEVPEEARTACDAAGEASADARWALINEQPNSIAGVRVIFEALKRDNFLSNEDVDALIENLLSCPALSIGEDADV